MRKMVPLILTFFMYNLCYTQHISAFTSLDSGAQDPNFHLPETHTFQYLMEEGDVLHAGGTLPDNCDFAGYVPREGSSKFGYLSINSEARPGAVTIFDIELDDNRGEWFVDHSEAVEFEFNLPLEGLAAIIGEQVGSTIANCSGTVTPWNTIITCEEVTNKDVKKDFPFIQDWMLKVDGEPNGYDGYGWAIELDPATKKVIDQPGGRSDQDKLWALGNLKHENVVIHENRRTVYEGADDTNGEGYLFKFVADAAEDLSSGKLYAYKEITPTTGEWILLNNTSISERNSTLEQCANAGATSFDGIEDVDISPIDGRVYFAVKGDGMVYRFSDSDPVAGTTVNNFETFAGGMSYTVKPGVTEPWGTGNDNLVFDDLGNLWVAQDGGKNYIWVVENGHTQTSPKVRIFARTPAGSEPTGLTFSPDYRYIFMSVQHPSASNSSSSQMDAFGNDKYFDKDVVIVIARNEHLGQDLTQSDQNLMISQYFHDSASDSKWIEVKNISDYPIAAGTYFLDLYDKASLQDITTAIPKASQAIPEMDADEVLLFKNNASPALPLTAHLGNAEQITSDVCDFNGEDMLLITTTPGKRKYNNRKDILGQVPSVAWGSNTTLIRGGNSMELPQRVFDLSNWFEMDSLQEVSLADPQQNIALGTYDRGPTTWDGSNWSALEPDRTRISIVNGPYQGGIKDIRTFDLKVNNGATLRFEDDTQGNNNNVVIYRNLEVEMGGNFIIGDTESLILRDPSASISGDIQKIERSAFRNDMHDVTYWSSPVQDEQIESVFDGVNPGRIFYYDQSKFVSTESYWDVWVNQFAGPMIVGKGYAAEGVMGETGEHLISFSGKPNYGTVRTENMQFNIDEGDNEDLDNDFNLIGNPYPAAIDMEGFLQTNAMDNGIIDGTVYLWTHATAVSGGEFSPNDYVTYNFVGGVNNVQNVDVESNIGSGQGFFVRATQAAQVIFEPDMILEGSNDQFFKGSIDKKHIEKDRLWINLRGSDNSFNQILIGFDERATDLMDSGFDAIYLKGNQAISFYSKLDNNKLSIQGLGPFTDQKMIKLGFESALEGLDMSMELSRYEGLLRDQDILLFDKDKGIVHDLKSSPYSFKYEGKGSFEDRFSLVFSSAVLGLDEEYVLDDTKVYVRDQHLIIDARNDIGKIKIYDTLGRLVLKQEPRSSYIDLTIDRIKMGGFFIVELVDDQGKNLTRKMVKY